MSSEELKRKRKTHTSSAVKNRYNAKTYKQLAVRLKPDLYQRIQDYTAREGISQSQFLQRAIDLLDQQDI